MRTALFLGLVLVGSVSQALAQETPKPAETTPTAPAAPLPKNTAERRAAVLKWLKEIGPPQGETAQELIDVECGLQRKYSHGVINSGGEQCRFLDLPTSIVGDTAWEYQDISVLGTTAGLQGVGVEGSATDHTVEFVPCSPAGLVLSPLKLKPAQGAGGDAFVGDGFRKGYYVITHTPKSANEINAVKK